MREALEKFDSWYQKNMGPGGYLTLFEKITRQAYICGYREGLIVQRKKSKGKEDRKK